MTSKTTNPSADMADPVAADSHTAFLPQPGKVRIGCAGIVNGMHEPDPAGAYVKFVLTYSNGDRHIFTVSRGGAEVLAAEIMGALSSGGTERPDAVRITAAAICQGGTVYQLPPPARHYDIIRHMIDVVGLPPPVLGEHGFVTSDGRFLPRPKAFVVAKDAGQIIPGGRPPNLLFSEDLW